MRTMQVGHVTVWSDEDGEVWQTMSFAPSTDLQRFIADEISYAQYQALDYVRQADNAYARSLLGRRIEGTA